MFCKGLYPKFIVVFISLLIFVTVIFLFENKLREEANRSMTGNRLSEKMVFSRVTDKDFSSAIDRAFLSNDGKSILLSSKNRIRVWNEDHGMRTIYQTNSSQKISESSFSSDGFHAIWLESISDNSELSSLKYWARGLGIKTIAKKDFSGSWKIYISGDGRRILLFPGNKNAKYLGKCSNKECPIDLPLVVNIDYKKNTHQKDFQPKYKITSLTEFDSLKIRDFLEISVSKSLISFLSYSKTKDQLLRTQVLSKNNAFDIDKDKTIDFLVFSHFDSLPLWEISVSGIKRGSAPVVTNTDHIKGTISLGNQGSIPVAGDYNGDGVLDFATFRPSIHKSWSSTKTNWSIYITKSKDILNSLPQLQIEKTMQIQWGGANDKAVPGDYDGDGITDIATYNYITGKWKIMFSHKGFNEAKSSMGIQGYSKEVNWGLGIPIPGDYNGDGQTDLAVWEEPFLDGMGNWKVYYLEDRSGIQKKSRILQFGKKGDIPVPADYNGDGITDVAIYRPNDQQWIIRYDKENIYKFTWGIETGFPVPDDYDGDGRADMSFYVENHPSNFNWVFLPSTISRQADSIMPNKRGILTAITFGGKNKFPQQIWLRKQYGSLEKH